MMNDSRALPSLFARANPEAQPNHTVPSGTDPFLTHPSPESFRGWLPSFSPSGTSFVAVQFVTVWTNRPTLKPARSPVETQDLLDILPSRLSLAIVHVNIGLAAARQVALKGVRFCCEQVIGVDNFFHKGNIFSLDGA